MGQHAISGGHTGGETFKENQKQKRPKEPQEQGGSAGSGGIIAFSGLGAEWLTATCPVHEQPDPLRNWQCSAEWAIRQALALPWQ
mmetsp:Transcript_18062/g.20931  ORF Transcript_18062/g.20931 Transcript_18062/m.20931 type:complete len:85 (-) Transcript_18062:74-328(-)